MNNLTAFSQKIIGCLLSVLLFAGSANAECEAGADALKQGLESQAVEAFSKCAINENDDDSQMWLGNYYQSAPNPATNETMKMLLFYHLSAENGNANAQVALAKILLKMDGDDEMRAILSSYMEHIKSTMETKNMSFKGEMLHPFLLLTLASEDEQQKWYYPTTQKTNDEALVLLQSYNMPEDRKKALLYEGSLWKQRKMAETAQEVLSAQEYQQFMDTLFPKQGKADVFERQRAVNMLKDKVEEYLKQ